MLHLSAQKCREWLNTDIKGPDPLPLHAANFSPVPQGAQEGSCVPPEPGLQTSVCKGRRAGPGLQEPNFFHKVLQHFPVKVADITRTSKRDRDQGSCNDAAGRGELGGGTGCERAQSYPTHCLGPLLLHLRPSCGLAKHLLPHDFARPKAPWAHLLLHCPHGLSLGLTLQSGESDGSNRLPSSYASGRVLCDGRQGMGGTPSPDSKA